MRRTRVYVDNSVISGTQDEEFAEESRLFFEQVREGEYRVLVSSATYDELEDAPPEVKEVLRDLPEGAVEDVPVDDEVRALDDAYVSAGALTERRRYDALHVAAASVSGADLILSWNFEHMVNYNRIQMFSAVYLLNGYKAVDIRTPKEVLYGG